MPVEIRELIIKTTVESTGATADADAKKTPGAGGGAVTSDKGKMKEQLVKECLNIIMDNFSSFNKER